jgi:hypothetical protein
MVSEATPFFEQLCAGMTSHRFLAQGHCGLPPRSATMA